MVERIRLVSRGVTFVAASALMLVLHGILPLAAPLAVFAYAVYCFSRRQYGESALVFLLAIAIAVVAWLLSWLLWGIAVVLAVVGLVFLIMAFRRPSQP